MGPLWTGTACIRPAAVGVTVATRHDTGCRPGRQQAGHIAVLPGARNRMVGGVTRIEFQPGIGLGDLPGRPRRWSPRAVGMAAEAQLVFRSDLRYFRTTDRDTTYPGQRPGNGTG